MMCQLMDRDSACVDEMLSFCHGGLVVCRKHTGVLLRELRAAVARVDRSPVELLTELTEIDQVLQESTYWVGSRLNTIKRLIAKAEDAECLRAYVGTVEREEHDMTSEKLVNETVHEAASVLAQWCRWERRVLALVEAAERMCEKPTEPRMILLRAAIAEFRTVQEPGK